MVRCLHCEDPQVVTRYNDLLWESLQLTQLARQASELSQQMSMRLMQSQQTEYESIDKASTELKRYAENKCRKIKAGVVPWCPQVSKAINRILYWKGLQSQLKGCKIGSSVLRQREKRWHHQLPKQLSPTSLDHSRTNSSRIQEFPPTQSQPRPLGYLDC